MRCLALVLFALMILWMATTNARLATLENRVFQIDNEAWAQQNIDTVFETMKGMADVHKSETQ